MKAIGVRELRQRASEFLREVERGQTVQVTAHGRPVAQIVPVRGGNRRDLLVASGRVVAGHGDVLAVGEPLPLKKGITLPGRSLARARQRER